MTVHRRKQVKAAPKAKKDKSLDKARLNLLIDPELKKWAHDYASRHHTSISALITHHLVVLKWKEEKPDVQQI
jgi:hypothetical protein